MNAAAAAPIEKSVVLVGAGNAHLVFLKRWSMRPAAGVSVTLVSEAPVIPYSAMVPGHIAGDFTRDEITIDLVRFCQSVGVRFVAARAVRIDGRGRQVLFGSRPPLTYDALSLGLGSIPAWPAQQPAGELGLVMRPLGALLRKIDALDQDLKRTPRPYRFAIVGGGASGCELAVAIRKRLGRHTGFSVTLLHSGPRLLPEFPAGVATAFERTLTVQGVTVQLDARVVGAADGMAWIDGKEPIAADAVLWATQASPPPLVADSGLAVDGGGFLRVQDTLQSVSDPAVFGSGDCVAFDPYPELPRNGVHAVRQGAVLFDNILSFLREQPLRPFRPQRFCLCLLNTADDKAILCYGPLSWKSRWARKFKDRIDRAWITKFTEFAPMETAGDAIHRNGQPEAPLMRCGGCGSKISSDVLSAVLKRIDVPDDPRVLMGCRAGEDAAVHRVQPELFGTDPQQLVEVQTVDYFKAFINDPYRFGRIAALNAVSDLYAMNARPFSALAIATLPYARGPIQESQLYELLSGAVESFRELGVVLTGGHTTEGNELALGFSVTGFGEEGRLFQKNRLQPGDLLILTRPLGTGALLAAWMRGECPAAWFELMMAAMLVPNRRPAEIFAEAGVVACTDVTGFGLAGHLLEMLDASHVSARLFARDVPRYQGFDEVASRGIVSSLHADNAKAACRVEGPAPLPLWLFDPQTSGGMLGAVRPERSEATLRQIREAGFSHAAIIGEVSPLDAGHPPVIHIV
jgi:selenide,water dikinase